MRDAEGSEVRKVNGTELFLMVLNNLASNIAIVLALDIKA